MTEGLLNWARLPAAAALLAVAREKIEHGSTGDRVRLSAAERPEERTELGRLFGLAWQSSRRPATLGLLRSACVADGSDLADLLVTVGGPLRDIRAEREAARVEQERRLIDVCSTLLDAGLGEPLADLIIERRWSNWSRGTLDLGGALASVWRALPPAGTTRMLAELASAVTTSPHGLDRNQDLGRLTARSLAARWAFDDGYDAAAAGIAAAAAVAGAVAWRNAWSRAGVICDRVSSTVLVLNLRLDGSAPIVNPVNAAAQVGEPLWLTARSLAGAWRPSEDLGVVRICENPSVVEAAADAYGATSAPLICTFGRPSVAAWTLLRGLDDAGVEMLVSADRDTAGDQIASDLIRNLHHAAPWLLTAHGLFEEDRLLALVRDLRRSPSRDST